jgi:hypothetical protein
MIRFGDVVFSVARVYHGVQFIPTLTLITNVIGAYLSLMFSS